MNGTPTVREARFSLAAALWASDGQMAEAAYQIELALDEPGDLPPTWELLTLRGDIQHRDGKDTGALKSWLAALDEGAADASRAYFSALEILEEAPESARSIEPGIVDRLRRSAEEGRQLPGIWLLVGHVALEQQDPGTAVDCFDRAITSDDEEAASQARLLKAEALIAAGDASAAYDQLTSWQGSESVDLDLSAVIQAKAAAEAGNYFEAKELLTDGATPDHVFVRALIAIGSGEPHDASEILKGVDTTELLKLGTVAALHAGDYGQASKSILAATSSDPLSVDAVLLRAQVHLESGDDIPAGRELLRRASNLDNVATSRWVALQRPFASERARFGYFLAELAATTNAPGLLELFVSIDRSSMTWTQDGAIDERIGGLLQDDDPSEAAMAYDKSARHYEQGGQLQLALDASRSAARLESSPRRSIDLALYLWRATHEELPPPDPQKLLDEALEVLDRTDVTDDVDFDTSIYLRGLVLDRTAQLAGEDRIKKSWQAVPYLMAAAVTSDNVYRPMYLAGALERAGATDAAVIMAERAHALSPDDATRGALIVVVSNVLGDIERVEHLIEEGFDDEDRHKNWANSVLLHLNTLNGRTEQLEGVSDWDQLDNMWVRSTIANRLALKDGVDSVRNELSDVDKEARSTPGEDGTAFWTAMYLGELDEARAGVREGHQRGNLTGSDVAWLDSCAALGGKPNRRATREAGKQLERQRRSHILGMLHIDSRICQQVYPGSADAWKTMGEHAERLLSEPWRQRPLSDCFDDQPSVHAQTARALAKLLDAPPGDAAAIDRAVSVVEKLQLNSSLERMIELGIARKRAADVAIDGQ